jgi:hypothetical protein
MEILLISDRTGRMVSSFVDVRSLTSSGQYFEPTPIFIFRFRIEQMGVLEPQVRAIIKKRFGISDLAHKFTARFNLIAYNRAKCM